jgi:hypothetical protein
LKEFDPETKHPVFWFAFLVCSLPVNNFSKRNLALISCDPPNFAKVDNPAILPYSALRNLENNGCGGGGNSGGGGGGKKKSSNSGDNSTGDSSSFTHTVELVLQSKEDRDLALLAVRVSTIREAIYTLQQIDADLYRPQTDKLQRGLQIQCCIKYILYSFEQNNLMINECKI